MTRKHFESMAAKFAEAYEFARNRPEVANRSLCTSTIDSLVNAFCELAIEMNPRFNRTKFIAACGKS